MADYQEAQRWVAWGMNDCAIGRLMSIPRGTIRDWRAGKVRAWDALDCPLCDASELDHAWYAYLLGLYLGDGCLSLHPRGVYLLRIVLDLRYPEVIKECGDAIRHVRPGSKVGRIRKIGCVEMNAYWKHWPCLFPQHGAGPKHRRRTELARWQTEITRAHPDRLLRGLIHSDGCRALNKINGTTYPRYMFDNRSEGIRAIFAQACDHFGVSWRYSNRWTISISRRDDVRKLDAVIGPKR
ncbi:MAG TPA: hypothetical protein VHL09_13190 [Dehalococcoidia bacterium]|nr:hypothetical protein [Dehalococcoidia bacterium]